MEQTSGQEKRHERIDEVMKNWFEAHAKEKKADSVKKEKEKVVLPVKGAAEKEKLYVPEHKNTEPKKDAVQKKGIERK